MCGIAICLGGEKMVSHNFIENANKLMEHRGPDDSGIFQEEQIALGHRRLAIIDLSDAGHQPMLSSDQQFVLVFNGEIYNHQELRKKHLGDYRFKSSTDTETILALYSRFGNASFEMMVGMWALGIWDRLNKKLVISRDRYGQKPLYYKKFSDGSIRFASEIKPLLEKKNYLDPTAVAEYLALGNYGHLVEKSFFKNILQLPPGTYADLDSSNKSVAPQRYWRFPQLRYKDKQPFDPILQIKLREALEEAVRSQLLSDVRVGATLSGGIDSTVVVGLMASLLKSPFPVFTAQTNGSKYDESKYVRSVEEKIGREKIQLCWKELITTKISESIYSTLNIQEEPFGDPSIIAHGFLMDAARENQTKVILGGQGADELFFGYGFMTSALLAGNLRRGKISWAMENMNTLNFPITSKAQITLSAIFPSLLKSLRRKSRSARREWLSPQLIDSVEEESIFISSPVDINEVSLESVERLHIPHLVHYDDRNAMARSIEGRMPFLDHRIADVLSMIRPEDFLKNGKSKILLRETCKDIIPDMILNRKDKIGFYTPLQEMIQKEKEWVKNLLQDEFCRSLNLFDLKIIREDFENIEKKALLANEAYLRIWRSLCIRVWAEMFNVSFKGI